MGVGMGMEGMGRRINRLYWSAWKNDDNELKGEHMSMFIYCIMLCFCTLDV
jgi:hypothetical protein